MSQQSRADLVIEHASQLAIIHDDGTGPRRGSEQGRLDDVEDGAVAVAGGRIIAVGSTESVRAAVDAAGATVVDATGKLVMPGLVDAHTHPLFGGLRHDEYAKRLAGVPMDQIFAEGGGMHRSVRETRAAPDDDILRQTRKAFARMLTHGTTAIEAKSGYGLNTEHELRSLRLLQGLRGDTKLDMAITFLGAHFVPEDWLGQEERYVDIIVNEMTPAVAKQGIAEFVDITVGEGMFSIKSCERMAAAAREAGLPIRTHAEGFTSDGGWRWSCEAGAVSADHVSGTSDDDIRATAGTNTIANLIPPAEMVYLMKKRGNARLMIESGIPVAICTDYCSSIHVSSLQASIGMACAWYEVTPAQAAVAATLNGAYSIRRQGDLGSLDVGKQADIGVYDVPNVNTLAWGFGSNYLDLLVKKGEIVVDNRKDGAKG
jgi:imidazolonepropionase